MLRERIAIDPRGVASRMSVKTVETLTGARTITLAEIDRYQAMVFTGGAADRVVTLPAVSACTGSYLYIVNTGATNKLTVNDAAAAAVAIAVAGEAVLVFCDGTAWRFLHGTVTT